MIEAAGGVIWRADRGRLEVLLIHRPRLPDWSLPKGKLENGETAEQCALREVHEETGYVCRLGFELPSTRYVDRKGRHKAVRYWSMERDSGRFRPNVEVDAVAWHGLDEAAALLTNERDVPVIAGLLVGRTTAASEGAHAVWRDGAGLARR